ncbi:MAG: 4Fe-4S binding protein [Lachnospiraceae bacterium]|nr:4Fe-4S binding protein [Lachnospiraceae bacterium]
MERRIIQIDEEKCNGCGACAAACHEGAIGMIDGKARLLRDDYCDGLGDCLPECPTGAISFVVREAAAYDEAAVQADKARRAKEQKAVVPPVHGGPGGCPGEQARRMDQKEAGHRENVPGGVGCQEPLTSEAGAAAYRAQSQLGQWPVQIKLAPVRAPYFEGAELLVAADCTAYAYAGFHQDFIRGKITLIGCPKLDAIDYSEKLTQIIRENDIRSVTVVRMEVPCCGGLEMAVKKALQDSGRSIPWQVVTVSIEGKILDC